MKHRTFTWMTVALLAGLLGGCGRAVVKAPNPIAVTDAEYDAVFDASIDVLRDLRFTVDRKDRRFGVVTTEPLIASSFFEPWHSDNTSGDQVAQATTNFQRRTVRIELTPETVTVAPSPGTQLPPTINAAAPTGAYQMSVTVTVERRTHPPMELNNTSVEPVRSRNALELHRPVITETGEVVSGWQDVGQDPLLEQRLISLILNKAVRMVRDEPVPAAPAAPASDPAAEPPTPPAAGPAANP